MSRRLVRTISAEISTTNTDTLLYTVPTGNTLIVFKKKIETTGGGSIGDAEVVFKEEIVSGNKQVYAVVNGEELVKERYEAGTSIYVNATSSCVASLDGILFDANMVPMQDPNYVPESSSSSDVPESSSSSDVSDSSSSSEQGGEFADSVMLTAPIYDENDPDHTNPPLTTLLVEFTRTEEMSNGYPIYTGTLEEYGGSLVTVYLLNKTDTGDELDFWEVLKSPEHGWQNAYWVKNETGPLSNGMVLVDNMGHAAYYLHAGDATITIN